MARDVSTDLSLHYSILPYEGRAMDPSVIKKRRRVVRRMHYRRFVENIASQIF